MMVTVWTSGTPGVLELPSGRRVRGGRVGHHPSPAPEHGLYLTWREPSTPWPSAPRLRDRRPRSRPSRPAAGAMRASLLRAVGADPRPDTRGEHDADGGP